jgi:hypothetical protein
MKFSEWFVAMNLFPPRTVVNLVKKNTFISSRATISTVQLRKIPAAAEIIVYWRRNIRQCIHVSPAAFLHSKIVSDPARLGPSFSTGNISTFLHDYTSINSQIQIQIESLIFQNGEERSEGQPRSEP